eukprot:1161827-Pelagomonas_calceolata.AAC.4
MSAGTHMAWRFSASMTACHVLDSDGTPPSLMTLTKAWRWAPAKGEQSHSACQKIVAHGASTTKQRRGWRDKRWKGREQITRAGLDLVVASRYTAGIGMAALPSTSQ